MPPSPMRPLVLASTSPTRCELLSRAGFVFETLSPKVIETLEPTGDPAGQAMGLARRKAEAVAHERVDATVIGADQVLTIDGLVFGKPHDEPDARAQLARLNGRAHALITGVCLVSPDAPTETWTNTTVMHVRALTNDEMDRYIRTNEWKGCAGGYRVEERGIGLFERIEGDYTNVLGLPMPSLIGRLRALGHPIF